MPTLSATTTVPLAAIAEQAASYFETRTREQSGEHFTCTRDETPAWVRDIIMSAHADMLPDDWRYSAIRYAFAKIAEQGEHDDRDDIMDVSGEYADDTVDVYNADRVAWLGSSPYRAAYCDDAAQDFGGDDADTFDRIGLGQYAEASEIFGLVLDGIAEHAETVESIVSDALELLNERDDASARLPRLRRAMTQMSARAELRASLCDELGEGPILSHVLDALDEHDA